MAVLRSEPGAAAARRPRSATAVWLAVAALTTVLLFANGALDIAVARLFYAANPAGHWPLAQLPPFVLLYRAATWITRDA